VVTALALEAQDRYGDAALQPHLVAIKDHCWTEFQERPPEHVKLAGRAFALSDLDPAAKGFGTAQKLAVGSYWLYCPTRLERFNTTGFSVLMCLLYFSRIAYRQARSTLKVSTIVFKVWIIILCICFCGSDRLVTQMASVATSILVGVLWPLLRYLLTGDFRTARKLVNVIALLVSVKTLAFLHKVSVLTARKSAVVKGISEPTHKWRALWNNTIMDFTRKLDEISIPNFIRSLPDRFDRDSINEANNILANLGWPTAPVVTEEFNTEPENIAKFKANIIGGTDIRQGIQRMELAVAAELSNLKGLAPEYKRTEQFATLEAELESISRYFEENEMIIPDLPLDDIWTMVSEIFANSQLTPFSYILKKWEKRYGLGPFWGTTNPKTGKWRKLSRKSFIKSIGGMANMVKLWAETFEVAPSLVGVAPVSIKSEALPPKKWMAGAVRTVIGAPIVHYISSTIWNFWPNHNFNFWSTNIKIGMPLNGACLSKLVKQHSRYDYHFGGDFSAFDSTLQGKILQLIAKVRKKGFERHRDYAKICHLIDANYYGLLNQPLMTTSTGNIYSKKTGLSTGHSSTGMDNSLALTILYLIAWKQLTGLSASEFRHYCKLSNYGDDHLLSWLATAPAAWTPYNIMNVMTRMKCTLRDEFPKFDKSGNPVRKTLSDWRDLMGLEFLSKLWRNPTVQDRVDLESLGIRVPDYIVLHNPLKLVGKAYAPSKDKKVDRTYRVKRLVGYLSLTAHQPDLYSKIRHDINLLLQRRDGTYMRSPVPVPTYNDVLVTWYDETKHIGEEDVSDYDSRVQNPILDYSMDGLFDSIVNLLSVVPDVLNPAIYNMGYINWIVATFGDRVAWPVELVRRANSVSSIGPLSALGKRTFYDFLFENPRTLAMQVDASDGDLLFRHWAFCLLRVANPFSKPANLLQWFDKKIAEVNFMANGYVQPYIKRFELPVFSMFTIAALSFINGPPVPSFVTRLAIPTAGSIVEFAYGYALNTLWSSVPANMKQSFSAIDNLSEDNNCVLVEAPTGTGKSTTFVNYVWRYFGHRYQRVFVVVPRQLLVLTLTPYLQSSFGLPAHPVTDGHPVQDNYRLIVTTPQEVLLHEVWQQGGNLFLVDECHVQEASVIAVLHMLKTRKVRHIMMSATPTIDNMTNCSVHVPLQIASTWTVEVDHNPNNVILEPVPTETIYWHMYRQRILDLIKTRTLSRFLVFVANRSHAYELSSRSPRRCCVLTATDKALDPTADVFIATSVADVGLTIPDVDWVVSSDLTRVKDPVTDALLWVRTDPLLLKQRKGRTGRTSNGVFTLIEFRQATFVSDAPQWTPATIGLEVLRTTGAVSTVTTFWPETIAQVLKTEVDRLGTSPELSNFVDAFGSMADVLKPSEQRTYRTTVDGVTSNNFWHISGNVIPTSIVGAETFDEEGPVSLTIKQGWDLLLYGAAYLARRATSIDTKEFEAYLRTNFVDDDSFITFAKDPASILAMNNEALKSEPSGRYGRRRKPVGKFARSPGVDIFAKLMADEHAMPPRQPEIVTPVPARPQAATPSRTPAMSSRQAAKAPAKLFAESTVKSIASGSQIFGPIPIAHEGPDKPLCPAVVPEGWKPLSEDEVQKLDKRSQLYYMRINRLWKGACAALGREPTIDDVMP